MVLVQYEEITSNTAACGVMSVCVRERESESKVLKPMYRLGM